jgi:hypothetical protein
MDCELTFDQSNAGNQWAFRSGSQVTLRMHSRPLFAYGDDLSFGFG